MKNRNMKILKFASATALSLALHIGRTHAAELVVIVNLKNPISSVTIDQVEPIYLGKTSVLFGGGNARPADLAEGLTSRDEFYQKVTGKSAAQVRAIWARLIFSGRGMPPKMLNSSEEVRKFVASDSNGIGYIEKSALDSTVKVVLSLP